MPLAECLASQICSMLAAIAVLYASSWLACMTMVANHSKQPFRQARNIGSKYVVINLTQQDVMP